MVISPLLPVHVILLGVGARESNPVKLRVRLSGLDAIHDALIAAHSFAERAALDGADASRLAIVVEELVTNLYDHGGLSDADEFEVDLVLNSADVIVTITDPGRPFDARRIADDVRLPDRGGGAGLRLVRSWASTIDYRRIDGRNRLVVWLPLAGE
jgi:anti-sigma regulatory factor (Ser/Thr protein kinase)